MRFNLYKLKNNKAFTLAEVLITLTIIGVIAAMTIPTLMSRQDEMITVTKVKKFHSTLSNALGMAITENLTMDNWDVRNEDYKVSADRLYELLFKPYFKISLDCGRNNEGDCVYSSNYKNLNNLGTATDYSSDVYYKIILSDGSSIHFRRANITEPEEDNYYGAVFYDVNGKKNPNQWGKDLFVFNLEKNKVVPSGLPDSAYPFDNTCKNTTYAGGGCAAWLIYKGNMDYLHCDDLSWNGKSKCK